MAFASNLNITGQTAGTTRFSAFIDGLKVRMERRRIYAQTRDELAALSNRDLADLGIHRSEIPRIAYQAAYEN